MANSRENPILISGGGIGGLTVALALAKSGKFVKVLEQAPEFGEVGAGIQLAANATNILQRLGVMEKINEIAVFPKRLVLKDVFTGKELSALNVQDAYIERYGAPYVVLHRADLLDVLLEACKEQPNIELYTNQRIVNIEQNDNSVTVTAESGATHTGEALIGADGIWSQARKLVSDDNPVCSGYVAYRGVIPMEEVADISEMDDVIMWIGPNLHVVHYPVRRGELYNQVVVFKSTKYRPGIEFTYDWGTPDEMDEVFAGSCETVKKALSFISRQKRWPMFDREPIENWTKGRVTLLGDAGHAMLQYLAQGGCQAIEDAEYLTEMLNKYGDDYETAFEEYQKVRIPRSSFVQRSARKWGDIIHAEDPTIILLRDTIFANRTDTDYKFVDQFHGYNLKKEKVEA